MQSINLNSFKFLEFIDRLNPKNSGIFFSILFHLTILVFAVGLPNFFGPKNVYVPNIVPIEILNITDTTNFKKIDINNDTNKNTEAKQKKFNSSDNTEVQKQIEMKEKLKSVNNQNQPTIEIKQKNNMKIEEKKNIDLLQKDNFKTETKVETIKTKEIKPKLRPKPKKQEIQTTSSDIQIQPKAKKENKINKKEIITEPKPKPKEDFSIASMLKDLRNDKSNNIVEKEDLKKEKQQTGKNEESESMVLSISEIDLLRQQLSLCWNAPAGAIINVGDKVTISAKVQQNMKVFENSVRIVDTNISKSNPFYGPITDSAMRTLLNPECTPLKLPKDKYSLWKNLTITFDYSIMKGY